MKGFEGIITLIAQAREEKRQAAEAKRLKETQEADERRTREEAAANEAAAERQAAAWRVEVERQMTHGSAGNAGWETARAALRGRGGLTNPLDSRRF